MVAEDCNTEVVGGRVGVDGTEMLPCFAEGSTGSSSSINAGVRPTDLETGASPRMSDKACEESFSSLRNKSKLS